MGRRDRGRERDKGGAGVPAELGSSGRGRGASAVPVCISVSRRRGGRWCCGPNWALVTFESPPKVRGEAPWRTQEKC